MNISVVMVAETLNAIDLIAMYESTGNKDFLRRVRNVTTVSGEVEYAGSLLGEELTYEQKFAALKYGVQHQKGAFYDPRTPVGELYRELFWDPDVDPVFYSRLRAQILQNDIARVILPEATVEVAEQKIEETYRLIVRSILDQKVQARNIDPAIRPLAEAVGILPEVQEAYRPLLETVQRSGNQDLAKKAADALGMEL